MSDAKPTPVDTEETVPLPAETMREVASKGPSRLIAEWVLRTTSGGAPVGVYEETDIRDCLPVRFGLVDYETFCTACVLAGLSSVSVAR